MKLEFFGDKYRFLLNRIREKLWVKPLVICILSIIGAFLASFADGTGIADIAPEITAESIESMLDVMATSMLVIATFAVASMVSAYASASTTATPRSFALIVSDDVSQNALSAFIGAFIFSIVALTAMKNSYYGPAGRFALFVQTAIVFSIVIFTFVRWVDRIARLGRMGMTIDKVEQATSDALERRRNALTLHGLPVQPGHDYTEAIYAKTVGYVQHIDMSALQQCAEQAKRRIRVAALPGTFAAPGQMLAYLSPPDGESSEMDEERLISAFKIGGDRLFDDDPRFGLVVLSEIAGRALSPAVNDPGTAIDVIGTLVRLFTQWGRPADPDDDTDIEIRYDRVEVPEMSVRDMFDDAFTAIARDGAGTVEVVMRLQKALHALTLVGHAEMREAAMHHSQLGIARTQAIMTLPEDLACVREAAAFSRP